jgi:hypothetical protein
MSGRDFSVAVVYMDSTTLSPPDAVEDILPLYDITDTSSDRYGSLMSILSCQRACEVRIKTLNETMPAKDANDLIGQRLQRGD